MRAMDFFCSDSSGNDHFPATRIFRCIDHCHRFCRGKPLMRLVVVTNINLLTVVNSKVDAPKHLIPSTFKFS